MAELLKEYSALPTIQRFHDSPAQIRCIVGPVGSGKTSGATWEVCHYIPDFLFENYGIKESRWAVIRNTYRELADTTVRTIKHWFPWGHHDQKNDIYTLVYPDGKIVELLFRACDRVGDVSKFLSLELTGYWIDESIEVAQEVKRTLKGRIGRYPAMIPPRWGIETTNPPDVEHPTYSEFAWDTPPPGPITSLKPLAKHAGFWQPPGENRKNLRPGYYDDLRNDYRDNPDWIARYIDSQPGIIIIGKLVYNNFDRRRHVAEAPLSWARGKIIRGWDISGNLPAAIALQIPRPKHVQVLREFYHDKMGIVDFGNWVKVECNLAYPNAEFIDWEDPAGEAKYSKKDGGFTSNADLMRDECGINVQPSEQNWDARRESVELQLGLADGILIDPSLIRFINGFIGGYHYSEIGKTGKFNKMPDQNRFAHIHSAFQYAMVKIYSGSKRKHTTQTEAEMDFDPLGRHGRASRRPMPTEAETGFGVYGS